MASSAIKDRELNFVLIASCSARFIQSLISRGIYLWGNMLYLYDRSDRWASSCQKLFGASSSQGLNNYKEIELNLGLGHSFYYMPLKEWVDSVVEWASR